MTQFPGVDSDELARAIRRHCLQMTHDAKASHIGSCLSVADILAVLYGSVMRHDPQNPKWPDRDRLIFSKGHAAAALYAVLAECGYFPIEDLATFCQDGSIFSGHVNHQVPGVELSTGSLGHGLPVAIGMALALKRVGSESRVFCVMSDGECQEGSIWEAACLAGHHGLDNLYVLIDGNGFQGLGRNPYHGMEWLFGELGFCADYISDGAIQELRSGLSMKGPNNFPQIFFCSTTKGSGVSFMEDQLAWHYKSPNDAELAAALAELA